jgi:putative nucleotidyltransferase with HDIG domain
MEKIIDLAKKIENTELQDKIISFLENPTISIETFGDELTIEEAPASKKVHQSYKGGLIEHTIAVTYITIEIINILQKVYQIDFVNKDLAIAGAILHDFYKPLTYTKSGSTYERSRLGSKIDHTSLIFAEAWHRKLPIELLHIILSHHGKGSSAQPRSLEALVLHLADYLDSQLLGDILLGAETIIKQVGRHVKIDNSKFAALICSLMTTKGIQGVREYLDTLK